jgi:p-hydroxybenzoate 3-monooxygenase
VPEYGGARVRDGRDRGGPGQEHKIECDFIAGCDGALGVSAASIPADAGAVHPYDYGIWWLTVLADAPAPKYP